MFSFYRRCLAVFIGLTLFASPLAIAQTSTETQTVSEIVIEGNLRVSESTVLAYLPIQLGDQIAAASLDVAIDRLFATQLFSNVELELENGILRISVEENAIINRVNIEGNDALSDERLMAELDIQPRRVYTRKLALEGAKRLLEIYRLSGRYAATVEPQIIRLDNNRIDLVFEVDEGPLIKISSIKFSGNQSFSDFALKQIIASREVRWWAFLSSNDKYDEARLDYDVRLLRQYYLSRGYADVSVNRAQGGLLPDRSGFAVTFELEEGPQYRLDDVFFTSEIEGLDFTALRNELKLEKGDRYDVRALEAGLLNITNALGNLGYAFVNVVPEVQTDPQTQTLDIQFNIGSARKNYVERIEIIDNSRTLDTVVRREFELVEGDAFNQQKLQKSMRNIRNLGYFRDVDVRTRQGSSPEQTVVEVEVQEQSTGDLSVGVGYSSIDKATFSLGINERNFLGTGRRVNLSTNISDGRSDVRLGLTEPYFLGRNLTGSFELFNERDKGDTSTISKTGFTAGVGFSAANDIYHNIRYRLASQKTTKKSTTATSETGENGKSLLNSAIVYRVGIDKLDNRFDPRNGYLAEVTETFSGLGGDVQFLRSEVKAAYYKPFVFDAFILGVRGRVGYIDGLGEKVTQSNRFFLGGRSVRGFDGGGIGPIDTGSKSAVGGNQVYNGTVEIVSTYGLDKDTGLRWTVYSDVGSVWDVDYPSGVTGASDNKMRQSVGFGLLWDTAIGPLSFSWSDAISKASHDKTKRFLFSIGTRF